MIQKHTICLIVPYFGEFPNYIDLVFKSCEYNPSINWLIFSDCTNYSFLPDNVKIVKMSFGEFRDVVQAKFEFKLALNTPYKLCDFKPAYGYILSDYLSDYDFWGYCDLDLIFGDIRVFVSKEVLDKYKKIFTLGHLSIYKNVDEINKAFMLSDEKISYKRIFAKSKIFVFDEFDNGINKLLKDGGVDIYPGEGKLADISMMQKKFALASSVISSNFMNYKRQVFYWSVGKVYRDYIIDGSGEIITDEVAYIHFKKRGWLPVCLDIKKELSSFYVTPDGFYLKKHCTSIKDFSGYNRGDFWGKLPYYCKMYKDIIKKKINKYF